MTASEVLDYCAMSNIQVKLGADGNPCIAKGSASPNQATLALLKTHRSEIIVLLGGQAPEPATPPRPWHWTDLALAEPEECGRCHMRVFLPEDSEFFCRERRCYYIQLARQADTCPLG